MRISDWSSDVCSSDLARRRAATGGRLGDAGEQPLPGLEDGTPAPVGAAVVQWRSFRRGQPFRLPIQAAAAATLATRAMSSGEIGRAHVCTPVTNAHLVCRLLLEKKKPHTLSFISYHFI